MTVANRPTDFEFENEQTGFDLSNYKIKMFGTVFRMWLAPQVFCDFEDLKSFRSFFGFLAVGA